MKNETFTDANGNIWTTACTIKSNPNFNCVRKTVTRPDGQTLEKFAQGSITLPKQDMEELSEFAAQ